jgi:hypothetical protein
VAMVVSMSKGEESLMIREFFPGDTEMFFGGPTVTEIELQTKSHNMHRDTLTYTLLHTVCVSAVYVINTVYTWCMHTHPVVFTQQ